MAPFPLIKPHVRLCRIRLSDLSSRQAHGERGRFGAAIFLDKPGRFRS
jgi:hypothetical protein